MTIAGSTYKKYESGKEILLTRRGDFLIAKALQMVIYYLQSELHTKCHRPHYIEKKFFVLWRNRAMQPICFYLIR